MGVGRRVVLGGAVLAGAAALLSAPHVARAQSRWFLPPAGTAATMVVSASLNRLQPHRSLTGHADTSAPIAISADMLDELAAPDRAAVMERGGLASSFGRDAVMRMGSLRRKGS